MSHADNFSRISIRNSFAPPTIIAVWVELPSEVFQMLAKILVGVVAAVAVTGVGIYYALPDYGAATCPGYKATPPDGGLPVSEGAGCCGVTCPAETASTEPAGCCAAKGNTDTLAACIGGMALTSAKPVATSKAAGHAHCCEE